MNVAVGLFGIHYLENLNHWMGWKTNVDYRKTIINNKEKIYDTLNCTFYSSTYFSPLIGSLINDYKPKLLKLREVNNIESKDIRTSFTNRNSVFIDTLRLIVEDKTNDCDFVLLTRYDLEFTSNPLNANVNYNKINFVCMTKWGDNDTLCDDNFYFMSKDIAKSFYRIISRLPVDNSSHEYHKYIKQKNFLLHGKYYSHEIPIYSIKRC